MTSALFVVSPTSKVLIEALDVTFSEPLLLLPVLFAGVGVLDALISTEADTLDVDLVVATGADTLDVDLVVGTEAGTLDTDLVVSTEAGTLDVDLVVATGADTLDTDVVSTGADTLDVDPVVSTEAGLLDIDGVISTEVDTLEIDPDTVVSTEVGSSSAKTVPPAVPKMAKTVALAITQCFLDLYIFFFINNLTILLFLLS